MMIVDATLGFDEVELFEFRYKYLSSAVDVFVIAESARTFSGQPKPLIFHELKKQGRLAANVFVERVEVAKHVYGNVTIERLQELVRDQFARQVQSAYPDSIVFFQDIDEIPSLEQISSARDLQGDFVAAVPMKMYFRRINWELLLRRKLWRPPKVFRGPLPSTNLRTFLSRLDLPGEPGAHFSFLQMGAERQKLKFSNYGHREYDIDNFWTDQFLDYCDRFGLDHLGRGNREGLGLLEVVPEPEYSDVVRQAALHRSEWVGGSFSGSLVSRAIRAQSVHNRLKSARSSKRGSSQFEPEIYEVPLLLMRIIRHVVALAILKLQKRAKRLFRRIYRLSQLVLRKIAA